MASHAAAYKKRERDNWDKFSACYTKIVLPEFRPFGRRLIELLDVRRGMWVLDMATGPGEPALAIARRVGPVGVVVGVDFSPSMIRRARARARAGGVRNAQFREMDAERLTLHDLMFDRAVCRFGLMLMPDAPRALAEMHRVLVPGGRVAVAVWSVQARVNTMGIVRRVLERRKAFTPPPGAPDFFRWGKSGVLARALKRAGFRKVRTERVTVEWVFKGPDDFWDSMRKSPALRLALAGVSRAVRRTIQEEVCRAVEKFRRGGRLRVPNEAILAVGVKAQAP